MDCIIACSSVTISTFLFQVFIRENVEGQAEGKEPLEWGKSLMCNSLLLVVLVSSLKVPLAQRSKQGGSCVSEADPPY